MNNRHLIRRKKFHPSQPSHRPNSSRTSGQKPDLAEKSWTVNDVVCPHCLFMVCSYDRTFREAFIRPGLDPERWGNRSNYAALNIVPTGPAEMSIYTTPFRRFTLRTDGFASVHVGEDPGELFTRPLRFTGKELVINYSTSAGGSVRVEIQDDSGQPIPGFSLANSRNLVGDAIEQQVSWTQGSDVSSLAGKTVRLRFVMQETDLFAVQFRL